MRRFLDEMLFGREEWDRGCPRPSFLEQVLLRVEHRVSANIYVFSFVASRMIWIMTMERALLGL
jgi:hypothetical protein